jgi:hypothetical protein
MMKEKVQEILQRELERLNLLSIGEGLGLNDFKRLDLLIKCQNTFVGNPEDKTPAEEPKPSTVEELLADLDSTEE